jgi:hypothetical protein
MLQKKLNIFLGTSSEVSRILFPIWAIYTLSREQLLVLNYTDLFAIKYGVLNSK